MEKTIIKQILSQTCFIDKPPVLVDVGASGKLRKIWKYIAPFSFYVAFDADTRDFKIEEEAKATYRRAFVINRLVSDRDGVKKFYLTKHPHCSSSLEPDLESLSKYHIKSFFEVEKQIELPAITLRSALESINISYIDWFKADTQGTDLRIFTSLGEEIINKILVAEFEPGILDAYRGEDKLYKIMEFFDKNKRFWCDECIIRGMVRMSEKDFNNLSPFIKRFISCFDRPAAFWAEISYMNNMEEKSWEKRDYLLMIVFAIIKKHYGFAIEITRKASMIFQDEIFKSLEKKIWRLMKWKGYVRFPFFVVRRVAEIFGG